MAHKFDSPCIQVDISATRSNQWEIQMENWRPWITLLRCILQHLRAQPAHLGSVSRAKEGTSGIVRAFYLSNGTEAWYKVTTMPCNTYPSASWSKIGCNSKYVFDCVVFHCSWYWEKHPMVVDVPTKWWCEKYPSAAQRVTWKMDQLSGGAYRKRRSHGCSGRTRVLHGSRAASRKDLGDNLTGGCHERMAMLKKMKNIRIQNY